MSALGDGMIIQSAYEKLLQLSHDSASRLRLQSTLCALRDELAKVTDCSPEEIQRVCEALARH